MDAIDTSDVAAVEPLSRTRGIVELVQDDADRVVANWVIHVANTPAFRAWPTLGLAALQRSVPDLIDAVLAAIRVIEPDRISEWSARVVELATEHGRERGHAGFPIGALLAEFKALRAELCAALYRATGDDSAQREAAHTLGIRLNTTLDVALIQAAEGWVDGARSRTAEG